MANYSFKTQAGFRIDVEGNSPENALKNILKLGMYKYPSLESHYLTPYFIKYDKDGTSGLSFTSTQGTKLIVNSTYEGKKYFESYK